VITIATLAEHPQLVPEVVEIAWREWGGSLAEGERERWLREAERDSRLHLPTSAGFMAVDGDHAIGVVQLHEFGSCGSAPDSPQPGFTNTADGSGSARPSGMAS